MPRPMDDFPSDALEFDPRTFTTSTNGHEPPEAGPDPFDPASLRLSQDFSSSLGVKKALLSVPVRKPSREWFIRTHPEESYRLQTAVVELKETREVYLVSPALWPELAGESTFSPRALFTAMTRQGVIFLWQVRLPGSDGRVDEWSRTSLEAAHLAMTKWVRLQANLSLGAYDVAYAEHLPEPTWPDLPFRELLRIAFKDRFIQSLDHPVLRQLRGEVQAMVACGQYYRAIWAVDCEFTAPSGDRPTPLCLVAKDLVSGRLIRRWLAEEPVASPPYSLTLSRFLWPITLPRSWGAIWR